MQKTSHFAHFPTYMYYYSIEMEYFTIFGIICKIAFVYMKSSDAVGIGAECSFNKAFDFRISQHLIG